MDKSTFRTINDFCDNQQISPSERDTVIRKFLENVFEAIRIEEARQGGTPLTDQQIKTIELTYLTDVQLSTLTGNAKQFHLTIEDQLLKKFQKNHGKSNFWNSVWTNLAANAIYSFLLIIAFILGKDLISSWLSSLLE